MNVRLSYDLKELDRQLRRCLQSATTASVRWGLCVHSGVPELLACLKAALTALASSEQTIQTETTCPEIACGSISDALVSAQQNFSRILILAPPATDEDADFILNGFKPPTHVTATIDHFYHAELLARAAQRHRKTIDVFVEVDAGQQWSGVRPGYDAQRLAIAASRLSGLEIRGVVGRLPETEAETPALHTSPPEADDGADHETDYEADKEQDSDGDIRLILAAQKRDAVSILKHSLGLIRRECSGANRLFITGRSSDLELIPCEYITDFADCSLLEQIPVLAECRILSRPTLQRAVINAGWNVFGTGFVPLTSATQYRKKFPDIIGMPGARIVAADHCSSVLDLSKQALDLTIGDTIRLKIR